MSIRYAKLPLTLAGLLVAFTATATVNSYKENFSSTTTNNKWLALNDACLTASTATKATNVIPGCTVTQRVGSNPSSPTYVMATADTDKAGALRLTPASTYQIGAILSNFTFDMSQGLQVTFTTYTYGGSNDGPAKDGADGITFMLTDGTDGVAAPSTAGGSGGSMGYSCSRSNPVYEGMANAYLGLGIDEWGNFLNYGDNGPDGITAVNSWGSGQYQPQRIGLRGAGNTTWAALNALNPNYYYPLNTPDKSKTTAACTSGQYVSSVSVSTDKKGHTTYTNNYTPLAYDYRAIQGGWAVLPYTQTNGVTTSSTLIANEKTSTRAGNTSNPTDYTKNAWPITYKLTLSTQGLLNFSYSYNNGVYQPVLVNHDVTADSGTPPAKLRFGFTAGTGGAYNVHEITCFQASPLQSNSSAGTNTIQSGEVKTNTQIYLASYSGDTWWGSLQAISLATVGGVLTVSPYANWDANCVLTGGACNTMAPNAAGVQPTVTAEAPSSRVLLTSNGNNSSGGGIPLEWANLTNAQQTILNSSDSAGANRLSWLRGVRSVEQLQTPPGTLRARNYVLGDIMDSSPTWVSAPYPGTYPNAFSDGLYGSTVAAPENQSGAQTYGAFVAANASRLNVVYVGGNDGLLHGFEAGSYSGGTYVSATNDGKEVLGYMPAGVLANKAVSLTNPNYVHDYLVDATPVVGDLFYGGNWHTWLVGGVGSSGQEIYALDITNPANFSETNASSLVMGDWTSASTGLSGLGNTVGTPVIARMHNGQWAIIFSNGLNGTGDAGVYIGLVDKTSGAVTFQFLDTGIKAGIAYVTSVDLDGDGIADYLYAGDTKGNVWRFDVTSNDATKWKVSTFGQSGPTPLFVAKDSAGNLQPITTAITVGAVQTGSLTRDMLYFGTGQLTPKTATHDNLYATGAQTFYGIWDWNMSNWNTTLKGSAKYAALPETQSFTRTNLLAQALSSPETQTTGSGSSIVYGTRSLPTGTQVCWSGTTTCTTGNTQFGWMFDLPDTNEQIIYNPTIIDGAVLVNTAIPPTISTIQCTTNAQSGWTMAFDPTSGGGLPQGFFPNAGGAFGTNSDGSTISGLQFGGTGTPTTLSYNSKIYLLTQTVQGTAALSQVNPPIDSKPARASWREIRN